jgi:hypothetical protein
MTWRRLSFVLLTVQAVALVFPTLLCGIFLLGGVGSVWTDALNDGNVFDLALWLMVLLALVSAWWLLLAFFYGGHEAARAVPTAVWVFAALISLSAVLAFSMETHLVALEVLEPGVLFVPTFVHLSAEVWFVRRRIAELR